MFANNPNSSTGIEDSPREDINDALHEADELVQRWNERLTINNLALAKRYGEGTLHVAFLWRRSLPPIPTEYLCAVFERELFVGGLNKERGENNLLCLPRNVHSEANADMGMSGTHGHHKAVFVENVHLMENPEIIYPSLVRFKTFDDTDCGGRSMTDFLRAEELLTGTYWEIGLANNGGATPAFLNGESHGEEVKCGPKIMDHISDYSAPADRDLLLDSDAKDIIVRLRLLLHNDGVGLTLQKGGDLGFKCFKMLLGPVDLYPATIQRTTHGKA